jgi:hypothetical protein
MTRAEVIARLRADIALYGSAAKWAEAHNLCRNIVYVETCMLRHNRYHRRHISPAILDALGLEVVEEYREKSQEIAP